MQCLQINVSKDIYMSIYCKEKIHESKENHSYSIRKIGFWIECFRVGIGRLSALISLGLLEKP